eukprot:TRINITY_DN49471_c0_g1_i1.p1 TRINITY_DN49471_c0_g1~~TRINITY_DN49471_c0_g1_i1.p1  ORF type:complete len:281 (-),score=31.62 TRINITY_DN49471_c0_g1_i1:110-952(-)
MRLSLLLLLCVCGYSWAHQTFVWMCLQQCGFTPKQITAHIEEVEQHSNIIDGVVFEQYTLNEDGKLQNLSYANVGPVLGGLGIKNYATLGTHPNFSGFLKRVRKVLANPQPFITSAIREARLHNYTGLAVEWLPTGQPYGTQEDLNNFVSFLRNFTTQAHAAHLNVIVHMLGVGDSVLFSDPRRLAASGVDAVVTLTTYTASTRSYDQLVRKYTRTIGTKQLAVALSKYSGAKITNTTMSPAETKRRLKEADMAGVRAIEVWLLPLKNWYWEELKTWSQK